MSSLSFALRVSIFQFTGGNMVLWRLESEVRIMCCASLSARGRTAPDGSSTIPDTAIRRGWAPPRVRDRVRGVGRVRWADRPAPSRAPRSTRSNDAAVTELASSLATYRKSPTGTSSARRGPRPAPICSTPAGAFKALAVAPRNSMPCTRTWPFLVSTTSALVPSSPRSSRMVWWGPAPT